MQNMMPCNESVFDDGIHSSGLNLEKAGRRSSIASFCIVALGQVTTLAIAMTKDRIKIVDFLVDEATDPIDRWIICDYWQPV